MNVVVVVVIPAGFIIGCCLCRLDAASVVALVYSLLCGHPAGWRSGLLVAVFSLVMAVVAFVYCVVMLLPLAD